MKKLLIVLGAMILPATTFAAGVYHGSSGLYGFISWINGLFYPIYLLIISISVITIVFYVFKYAVAGGEDDKSKAKTHIIWGVIGLFVMVSIWGLVSILRHTFDLGNGSTPFSQDAFPSSPQQSSDQVMFPFAQ